MNVDHIFTGHSKIENYTVLPPINGLCDHEAWLIETNVIDLQPINQQYQTVRTIVRYVITDFLIDLSYELWGTVFLSNDSDTKFDSFFNTHFRIIYLNFPYKRIKIQTSKKTWTKQGKNSMLKIHYKKNCKVLSNIINGTKKVI
jgi:hypothetical protein